MKDLEHILKTYDKDYNSAGYRHIKKFDDKDEYVSEWNRLSKEEPAVYEDIDLKKVKMAVFKSGAGYTALKYIDKSVDDETRKMAERRWRSFSHTHRYD